MAPRRAAHVIRALLAVAAATVLATAGCAAVCRHITINVTPSLPRGLYWLTADHDPRRGSIVVLFPPAPFRMVSAPSAAAAALMASGCCADVATASTRTVRVERTSLCIRV